MSEPVVQVLLFAAVREVVGARARAVPVDETSTAGSVLAALCAMHPALAAYVPSLRVAVNGDYVTLDAPVRAGDEVAIIPPVAGG
jgi:molybdopterin converting factor subunit 1